MGINAIIPLIGLATTPELLLQTFKLISACLSGQPENQLEAKSQSFFKSLTEAMLRISGDLITPEVADIVSGIVYNIVPQLRDDMLEHFLWELALWSSTSRVVQEKHYGTLAHLYNSSLKLTKAISIT
jgi:hypothetical protein